MSELYRTDYEYIANIPPMEGLQLLNYSRSSIEDIKGQQILYRTDYEYITNIPPMEGLQLLNYSGVL